MQIWNSHYTWYVIDLFYENFYTNFLLFVSSFKQISTQLNGHISMVGPPNHLYWINNFSASDWSLISYPT